MNMQIASLLSGLAISKTRTALAHSISYPLTSRFKVPHGLACSFTLVSIIDFLREEIEFDKRFIEITESVKKVLIELDLKSEISSFLTYKEAFEHIDEMYSPERADNFLLPVNLEEISYIIESSFN